MVSPFSERLRHVRLPLVPILPAIVIVVGVATAIAVGQLALWNFRTTSDEVASTRAQVLASTLAMRLRATSADDREDFTRRAARRTGAEIVLCNANGEIQVDATFGSPTRTDLVALLVAEQGEWNTKIGRTQFATAPLSYPFDTLSVVAFVPAPEVPLGANALLRSISGLTSLLIGVAAIVAYLFARDLHQDVDFVRSRIAMMAETGTDASEPQVPVRAADQVGVLTNAFNVLLDRFLAAERAYVRDLDRVASLDRDRAAFLSALSHELRNPLNAILGFTDVLLSEVDGMLEANVREDLEMVRSSGAHLRGLIDDIIELSALESGQLRLSRAMVDVRAVAEDVVREAFAVMENKPVTLVAVGESPTYVFADERRLRQILSNLVGNAVKFTKSGSVEVRIEAGDDDVMVEVTDTGPGIPESALESIFNEYHQVGIPGVRERGTGLGLFIARRLVRMHGGTIEVVSQLGRGAKFVVRMPVWSGQHEIGAPSGVTLSSNAKGPESSAQGRGGG